MTLILKMRFCDEGHKIEETFVPEAAGSGHISYKPLPRISRTLRRTVGVGEGAGCSGLCDTRSVFRAF